MDVTESSLILGDSFLPMTNSWIRTNDRIELTANIIFTLLVL
jgi:hypothetical protein